MVVLVGQVARHQIDREAFQEVDFRKMFAPLAKWVAQIDMAERMPELVNQAFQVATSGRPGPVVLALPEDMLRDRRAAGGRPAPIAPCAPIPAPPTSPKCAGCSPPPSGRSCWSAAASGATPPRRHRPLRRRPTTCRCAARFVARTSSTTGCRSMSAISAPAPPRALVARFKAADLVLAVGARIGEITSQSYSLMGIPDPGKTLIHVHAAAEELGRVFRPIWRSSRACPSSPPPRRRWRRSRRRAGREWRGGGPGGIRGGARAHPLAGGPGARSRPGDDLAARAPARRCDRHQRRRQFQRLAQPVPAIPAARPPARPDQRRDGLRRAGGGRARASSIPAASSSAFAAMAAS